MTERDKCAHLLRRFGLGASEAELDYYLQSGLKGAIETLLSGDQQSESLDLKLENLQNDKGVVQVQFLPVWFGARLLITRRPLVEKMALFWHNHFATSGDKVTQPYILAAQNDLFRTKGLGNFKDLLLSVSQDPAMLIWLDGQDNIKGRANENFAREVMELFTLGVGHYTEKDIQEAARAFTGWSFARKGAGRDARAEYVFKPKLHDTSVKAVLGKSGNLTGEDVIDHLCSLPRTAEFITEKIWKWFVYENPKPETLKPHIKAFSDSGLEIKALLRSIMSSEEFYSERSYRKLVKNPVDFCASSLRSLGLGEFIQDTLKKAIENNEDNLRSKFGAAVLMNQVMKNQGMWLMFPPDVSGWKPGDAWITSATMVERINWGNRLMGASTRGNVPKYPIYNLLSADPTPLGIAKKLCSIFDAPISGAKLETLARAANSVISKDGLTPNNANKAAAAVTRLICGSPEFQFA